ncbi:MAG: hypothetical protein J7L73_03130 [Anaerolineales bacterium]|nr:hypothetical protein [Anaerolineales bacterium]
MLKIIGQIAQTDPKFKGDILLPRKSTNGKIQPTDAKILMGKRNYEYIGFLVA